MKRLHETVDIKYAVMETIGAHKLKLQFMPQLWLVPAQNSTLKERDIVKYYFPVRSAHQSPDSFLNFVKQAKFNCVKPKNDGKWELCDGRILKMGLGTIEEAIGTEKLYSDYFSTTEAESETPVPEPKKRFQKKKKTAAPKAMMNFSESEEENAEVTTISNYNVQFGTGTQDINHVGNIMPITAIDFNQLMEETIFGLENNVPTPQVQSAENLLTYDDKLLDSSNEVFMTLDVPIIKGTNIEALEENGSIVPEITNAVCDLRNDCAQGNCCKGHQKVLNKLDYVNKKISKDIGILRQETAANRKLLLQVINLLQPEQNKDNEQTEGDQDEQAQLNVSEIDSFNEKYKATFPIKDCDFIIDFNKSMKDDQQFVNGLLTKLSQVKGNDEAKTARNILKELCHFRCLMDFTWEGTKKGMKSFQNLHLIVELITKLLTKKYPDCDAFQILKKVVQQRTKSAKEAFDRVKLTDQNNVSLAALDSEQGAAVASAVNAENNLMTTESQEVVSTVNTANEKDEHHGSSD